MADIRIYQLKSEDDMEFGSTMENKKETEQPEVQNNWVPETPAKPAPTRMLKFYSRRCQKGNSATGSLAVISKLEAQADDILFVGAMTFADKSHEQKDQKPLSMEPLCSSDGVIGLAKSTGNLEDVDIGFTRSEDVEGSEEGIPESASEDYKGEPASFVVGSPEDSDIEDFNLEKTNNSLEDRQACTGNVARRLDFSALGLGNLNVPSDSIPSTEPLSYAGLAPPCIGATTQSEDQSSSQEFSRASAEGAVYQKIDTTFALSLDQENNTNIQDYHATRCDGQKDVQGNFISSVENEKLCSGERLEPATPSLKQNFNKRSRNGIDVDQRPLKRTKIKKHRHRPKVAGAGRKRRVSSSLEEKEKRKNVTKTQPKEKEKSKYVRRSLKTSTTEHHTESVAARSELLSVVNQPSKENYIEVMQPNASGELDVVIGDQERDDKMMLPTMSELAASHGSDDNKATFWDLSLEMKSKEQCTEKIRGQNLLEIKHSRFHKNLRSAGCHSRFSWNLRNASHNKNVEPSFPKEYKRKRMRRKPKSKISILLRFLDLYSHPKKKRCKGLVQRIHPIYNHKLNSLLNRCTFELAYMSIKGQPAEEESHAKAVSATSVAGLSIGQTTGYGMPTAPLVQDQPGLAPPIRGIGGFALGMVQSQIWCPRVSQLSAPSYPLPVIRPPGQGCPLMAWDPPPPHFVARPAYGLGFPMPPLLQQFGRRPVGMLLQSQVGLLRGLPAPPRPGMLLPRLGMPPPGCGPFQPGMPPPPPNPQLKNQQQCLLGPKKRFNNRKHKNLLIDDIGEGRLDVCDADAIVSYQDPPTKIEGSSAIVPYQDPSSTKIGGSSAIVLHKHKKKKLTAQVLLDKETIRQWNLLVKIDNVLGEKEEDKEREKKWEEEVEIFHGRIKSFTSRMHVILGDRRFKPWKGSVVDSVVGVFLTQNVTDFLSSAAYMSLASKYPIQSKSNQEASDDELDYKNSQEPIGDDIVCTGTTENLHANGYFITEFEEGTSVDIVEEISLVDVKDIGNAILQKQSYRQEIKALTHENPENASRGSDSRNPISGSERSNSLKATFEMPCSSSSACHNSYNSHLMEDHRAENVVEEKASPDMDFLPQDCSLQAEVGITSILDAQSVLHDEKLNMPEEVVWQDSALNPIAPATSMKNKRSGLVPGETRKTTKGTKNVVKEKSYWNDLGRKYSRPRSSAATDSIDWEAVRQAPETEIADAIKSRGQHNIMARKIKKSLNRILDYHGSIDLEWLRHAPDDDVKVYLLEIEGLGLKSVECLRLLTLYHDAFPVDTNVARIAVRLGWVPLEPLPGVLQLHLLEEYPVMDTIQKYLWPRLCKLDQKTLYELHYQMITFGKVFCTKLKPNCGVCPMRAECRHLASAIASEYLCLPGIPKRGEERSKVPNMSLESSAVDANDALIVNPTAVSLSGYVKASESKFETQSCEPLIEEPKSPEPVADIEDFEIANGIDINDGEEIPIIQLSNEPFRANVQYFMDEYRNNLQTDSSSRALVPLSVNVDSVPVRKLKNISRLRTEHQVYEIPDDHELLIGLPRRDRNDQSPYLLAIWTPGESPASCQPPEKRCNSQGAELCKDETCFYCQSIWEERTETVRGTILVPCRTAMRGRFPLNGTYFQVNEVFADHESSYNAIIVPRSSIWYLRRRIVYCGTSPNAIFKACSLKEIQENFWKGFICVRGWDAKTGAPKPLAKRFHCPPSKMVKNSSKS
ncbi:uncharacterized protein LOC8267010 isoform X1 [Ricinus communis]|uniref:uncharacterized protein LOC8267010 isoform X1 n=2 Tax=Ricinus communis TaxID=3988 RepID=UPI00201A7703|nr:uncharacterized protein LOC8267010 isoform X1 [Ricinus communis]XP_048234391.1 uncharacterized protein LOC8267010 isoform X1 [Ricinus communis]